MKTCESCRFLAAPRTSRWDDEEEIEVTYYETTCVRIIHGNRHCGSAAPSKKQPAMVVDGSGYSARLLVLPTFGCVLHEEKK
jgi:hypothetical protein